jgi:hypothetical protein
MTSLQERLNKWLFLRKADGVLQTPPLRLGVNDFTAISMVQHRDVVPYLLAVKSFAAYASPSRVVLVADPTLNDDDRSVLRRHVPRIEIFEAKTFRRNPLPEGGCWERLSAISTLNAETSVVQLDADTLTTGPLDEVVGAAREARSFVLRSESGVELTTLDVAAANGRGLLASSSHIQAIAEARLEELPDWQLYRYARGCAGFTGFGRGALDPCRLDVVSAAMRALHGTRWDEWGSEQVTSNLMAASAPGAFMLPHPRYCNADSQTQETRLAHYIGYARFTSRAYERKANQVIQALAEVTE